MNNNRQIIFKNPPNTARIQVILEIFPNAKFIFIHRNPYDIFYSTSHIMRNIINHFFSLQKLDESEVTQLILHHFKVLNDAYSRQKSLISSDKLIEVSYQELIEEPFDVISHIYRELDLPDFSVITENLRHVIRCESQYEPNKYDYRETEYQQVERYWKEYIDRWSYSRPKMHDNSSRN
ncbi:MAG: sulfotransferase [FCB group bacterium]|nr:sulfotransferase [FCB group bacterium]